MIQTLEDALVSVKVGESDVDILNEVGGVILLQEIRVDLISLL